VDALKAARATSGLTQAQLGDLIGKDQSFVSLIEGGQRRVDLVEFYAICTALRADPIETLTAIYRDYPDQLQI
jgi:transcriptional regulator with XRE-family HTH domain